MILILWITISLLILGSGIAVMQPRRLMDLFRQRFYCAQCHKEITASKKFREGFVQELGTRNY